MPKYTIEFIHENKKAKSEVVIEAKTEAAAKHKFYAKHPATKKYLITSIDIMKAVE